MEFRAALGYNGIPSTGAYRIGIRIEIQGKDYEKHIHHYRGIDVHGTGPATRRNGDH
jgi:hypothetical protein